MSDYLTILYRIIAIWPLLFIVTLFMGQRNLGQLPVFDFIIVITIGSIAGADLADPTVPNGPTIMTLILIALIQWGFSKLMVRWHWLARMSYLTPTVVIQDGTFLTHNIAAIRYTVNDLLPLLRKKGVFNLSEVDWAIVEPDGNLSVMKKASDSPVTPSQLGLTIQNTGLPWLLVADGKIVPNALKTSPLKDYQLEKMLKQHGLPDLKDVYIASLEGDGTLFTSPARPKILGRSIHY